MTVDLRSDTVTRPTPAMRARIAEAEVGDDVFGDDPSVNRLEALAARRLGKEAALFVPSGTMANQIALLLHTRPGDEVLMEDGTHPYQYEAAGAAAFAGAQIRPVVGAGGLLRVEDVAPFARGFDPHRAPARLLSVEDTANAAGGRVYPLEDLDALTSWAHDAGLATHLDGARLFNAAIASGVPADRRARGFDTVSICLSKGLGAPVGSLLLMPAARRDEALRHRKRLGGGMRQAGFLAAAGEHALEHHVERLAEDHARAATLAAGLVAAGFEVRPPETNMVYLTTPEAAAKAEALAEAGVLCCALGPETLRLVTHLDVGDADIDRALEAFAALA